MTFIGKSKKEKTITETLSTNLEENSHVVKNSLFYTKKFITPASKFLDYGIVVLLTVLASKLYFSNL
tara:strand:- start:3478 stop:3678 length:201 start_codon:yes stop_codon:yes gene_type:complete